MEDAKLYAALVISFIECVLLAGSVFGWPSMVYVLQDYGLYQNLCHATESTICENSTGPSHIGNASTICILNATLDSQPIRGRCLEQKVALSDAYTAAIAAYGLSAFPMGLFFDRFGLRTTRTIIALLGASAQLMIAFANPGTEWLVFTGAVCLGISNYGLLMTACHVALLAKAKTAMVTAIFLAGLDTSFGYTAVKFVYDAGVSRVASLVFEACLWVLVLISSWFLLPKFKVTNDEQGHMTEEQIPREQMKSQEFDLTVKDEQENHEPSCEKSELRSIILSVNFALFVYWFGTNHVRINMMNDSYDAWMTAIVDGDVEKVSYFTNMLAIANLLAVVPSPVIGIITDKMRAKFGGTGFSLIPAVTLATTVNILMTIFLFPHREFTIYVSVVFFVLAKPMVYSTAGSYMALLYPTDYFGVIYGITFLIAGLSAFIMYPYFSWIKHTESFFPVNCLILVTLVLSLSLPVKLYHEWRHQQDLEMQPLIKAS